MKLQTFDLFKKCPGGFKNSTVLEKEILKKYQFALLQIADDIIRTCEENNICYSLSGGSVLGAVRHQGFIPWDDDIDLFILGKDFNKFIESFKKEYGDRYWIHTSNTNNYGLSLARIRLKGSIFRGRDDFDNDECGFFVDIFKIENIYDNILLRSLIGAICTMMCFLLTCRNFYKNREYLLEFAGNNIEILRIFKFKILIGRIISFWSVTKWSILTQKFYGLCKNNNSKYVSIPAGRKHYFGEIYRREDMVETIDAEFEGHKWKIPKGYDAYLTQLYGDYMEIPDEEHREKHLVWELKFPDTNDRNTIR